MSRQILGVAIRRICGADNGRGRELSYGDVIGMSVIAIGWKRNDDLRLDVSNVKNDFANRFVMIGPVNFAIHIIEEVMPVDSELFCSHAQFFFAELAEGNEDAALAKLQQALAMDPANEAARIDYVKLLLDLGRAAEARRAFEPVAGKAPGDARLATLGQAVEAFEQAAQARRPEELAAAIATNKRDFAARHELAQVLLAAGRRTEALDELLEILMRDKAWNDGLARKLYVAILELMTKPAPKAAAETKSTLEVTGKSAAAPSDPVVDQYRRRLSMVIF